MIRRQGLYSGVAIGFGDDSCNSIETGTRVVYRKGDRSRSTRQELYSADTHTLVRIIVRI